MGRSQPARADDFVAVVVRLFEPCGPQPPAAEARKRAPQAAPDIPYEVTALTFAVKPLFRTLRRIPLSDCLSAPAAGYRARETGILDAVGTGGHWWLSSSFATGNLHAGSLDFGTESVSSLGWLTRSYGVSVRCVQHYTTAFTHNAAQASYIGLLFPKKRFSKSLRSPAG